MKNIRKSKGFTLVELLIVIAIIGVLASLIYPALSQAMGAGSKMKSMNGASNIAKTWMTYVNTKQKIVAAEDIHEWAGKLAVGVKDFNDPSLWILDFDEPVQDKIAIGESMPVSMVDDSGRLLEDFKSFPISWAVANFANNSVSSAPLIWTRGLKPNGTWDFDTGVFKDEGGHIAFTDAHVTWYATLKDENSGEGVLKVYGKSGRTSNISQAIKGGSQNILQTDLGY